MSDTFKDQDTSTRQRRSPSKRLSISEEAQNVSGLPRAPFPLNLLEKPFQIKSLYGGPNLTEATGWAMDSAARGPLNQAGSFVGTALLRLALAEAGCENPRTCTTKVYGFKPTNILTMSSVVVGLASAILMPIVGAIVDHTKYRKFMGALTAFLVCFVTGLQLIISQDTWFPVLILEIFGGFFFIAHLTSTMAFLPDLTMDEAELSHYTARFNIAGFTFQMVYVSLIILTSEIVDSNNLLTAKISLAYAFPMASVLLGYAWTFLFHNRPPLRAVPDGSNLLTAGFVQVGKTSMRILRQYKSLRWFMFALLWSPESGAGAVLSITVTYMVTVLQMSTREVGITNLVMLVFTIPGSFFSQKMVQLINPLRSFRASLVFFSLSVGITGAILDSPEKKNWTYFFASLWGIAFGWVYPSQRVLQCTLIPKGQETEMMGVFAFFAQLLGWLPPLIFSIMNSRGVDMRWGIAMIAFFILFAFYITLLIGDYDAAVLEANPRSEKEEIYDEEDLQDKGEDTTDDNDS
uniref:Major facilitator superfamily (MFS) profile domain-containing protein n=1 Tax=Ditylum brightwellii TaxID=49249 RepID=A0A7S2A352_9STRA|mmetsp:Transcript_7665/g.11439  ORF Transcript_7665/g.11439 Transcript_7665/m.11439 type:complete len:519 (+) Transcript_7665:105-1661(+)